MKVVALDVHGEWSQLTAVEEQTGEVLLELKVRTEAEELRRVVGGLPGPKTVVFEEGSLSGMVHDALKDVAERVISCDPTRNALVARAEHSDDRLDARRLITLHRAAALHPVYVPPEPYRTLRSLLQQDHRLARAITGVKNCLKALCRRQGIPCRGVKVYQAAGRKKVLQEASSAALRWQLESLYRQLDFLRVERVGAHRLLARQVRGMPIVGRLQGIPGVGPITARTLVAWIVDPQRFQKRSQLSAYGGLGLSQGFTNWQMVARARASKRGQREVKRVLFLAAHAAVQGENALSRRYQARLAAGWPARKAMRDLARRILFTACALWRKETEYQDGRVSVPLRKEASG